MIAILADCGILLLRFALVAIALVVIVRGCGLLLRETMRERHLASRRDIARRMDPREGDRGGLGAIGCALGGVCRRKSSELGVVRAPWGRTLLLGAPDETRESLRAALKEWQGALVYVDSRGGSKYLYREDVIRCAPGRIDGAAYNPMLAIRGGMHAWTDAKHLAQALAGGASGGAIEIIAALILDHLHVTPVQERSLAGLRRRLSDPEGVFSGLPFNVHERAPGGEEWSAHPEINWVSRFMEQNPTEVTEAWRAIEAALRIFSDGRVQCATNRHQIDLGDLLKDGEPSTLVLELPPSDQTAMAPLIAAILAQLVATCTEARAADWRERPKSRPILLVIDDIGLLPFVPLLKRRLRAAADCGLYVLIAAQDIGDLTRAFGLERLSHGESVSPGEKLLAHFDSIAAIGPQKPATARILSERGGTFAWFEWVRRDPPDWKDFVLPYFIGAKPLVMPVAQFEEAKSGYAHLFLQGMKPFLASGVSTPPGAPGEIPPASLRDAPHDWSAAPAPQPEIIVVEPVPAPPAAKSRADQSAEAQGELSLSVVNARARVPKSPDLRKMLQAKRPKRKPS